MKVIAVLKWGGKIVPNIVLCVLYSLFFYFMAWNASGQGATGWTPERAATADIFLTAQTFAYGFHLVILMLVLIVDQFMKKSLSISSWTYCFLIILFIGGILLLSTIVQFSYRS